MARIEYDEGGTGSNTCAMSLLQQSHRGQPPVRPRAIQRYLTFHPLFRGVYLTFHTLLSHFPHTTGAGVRRQVPPATPCPHYVWRPT